MRIATILASILAVASALALLSGAGRPAIKSRYYEVGGDLDAPRARALASYMDAVFQEYSNRFRSFPVKNAQSVRLYLYASERSYLEGMREKGFDAANTAGVFFYSDNEAGLAAWFEGQSERRLLHTLQHEGFHQFAHLRIGEALPIWANEGIAEYFGQSIMVKGSLRTGLAPEPRVVGMRKAIENDRAFTLRELISMTGDEWGARVQNGDARAGLQYDQSWSVAHFLIHADNGRYAKYFEEYLRAAADGLEPEAAFNRAFKGSTIEEMERVWKKWTIEAWEPDPVSTAADRVEFLAEGLLALHARGVTPTSIDGLKDALRRVGFVLTRSSHGVTRVDHAKDDALFEAPRIARSRTTPSMTLTPPPRGQALPTIIVKGLPVVVRLVWNANTDGSPRAEIRFE